MLTIEGFKQALRHAQSEIEANKDTLTDLDRAIGDGDHGINMSRGFEAVVAVLDDDYASLGDLSKKVGMTLMSKVGGAAGPLYGSAFVKAAPKFGDATEADFSLVKKRSSKPRQPSSHAGNRKSAKRRWSMCGNRS